MADDRSTAANAPKVANIIVPDDADRITAALVIYWVNLSRVNFLADAVIRDRDRSMNDSSLQLDEIQKKIESGEQQAEITKSLDRLKQERQWRDTASEYAQAWYVVMHVACVENFIEDILVFWSSIDPAWLKESKQTMPAPEILDCSDIDDLKRHIRRQWAKNWRDDKGPRKWIECFERFGVRGFAPGIADTLEEMWAVRNLIVHDGGVINARFLKRAPSFANQTMGRFLKVSFGDIARFVEAMKAFVEPIDKWTFQRYPDQPMFAGFPQVMKVPIKPAGALPSGA